MGQVLRTQGIHAILAATAATAAAVAAAAAAVAAVAAAAPTAVAAIAVPLPPLLLLLPLLLCCCCCCCCQGRLLPVPCCMPCCICQGVSRTRILWFIRLMRASTCACDVRDIVGVCIGFEHVRTHMHIRFCDKIQLERVVLLALTDALGS